MVVVKLKKFCEKKRDFNLVDSIFLRFFNNVLIRKENV